MRQRVAVFPAERVETELRRVGDRGEVDDLPPAAVPRAALFLQPTAAEVIRMPPGLDGDDGV
ncbi:hypothetical protein, partial [Streptomyces sp. NPDC005009]